MQSQNQKILQKITHRLAKGSSLLDIMSILFEELPQIMVLDRIGIAILDENKKYFVSKLNISTGNIALTKGYKALLANSSLGEILNKKKGRVINNLPFYLEKHPSSNSTKLVVSEGMQSNISTPLFIDETPIGILFLASKKKSAYSGKHLEFAEQISDITSLCLQKADLKEKISLNKTKLDTIIHETPTFESPQTSAIEPTTWKEWERHVIETTLNLCNQKIYGEKGAAKRLDLPPTTLQSKMKRLGFPNTKNRKHPDE